MTEAKHTTGPWKWDGWTLEHDTPSNNGDIILGLYDYGCTFIKNDADMALISAAPDMLDALRKAEKVLGCDHPNGETVVAVRAAISKATAS